MLRRKQREEKVYSMGYTQVVTHPSTNPARQGLTLVIGPEPVLSLYYFNASLLSSCILIFFSLKTFPIFGLLSIQKDWSFITCEGGPTILLGVHFQNRDCFWWVTFRKGSVSWGVF